MADIICKVKKSIQSQSEEQKKALEKVRELTMKISSMQTVEDATNISSEIEYLTTMQKAGIRPLFKARLDEINITYDKTLKKFVCSQSE